MTLAPVISGNIFNLIYGTIYDHHSSIGPDDHRDCGDGLGCYSTAYWITFGASVAGLALSLWSIWHDHVLKAEMRRKELREEI